MKEKAIIHGKRYDVENSEFVAEFFNGLATSDFNHFQEKLYRTKKGNFFISGTGGAMTSYSRPAGDMTSGGSSIRPISETEALEWLERHGETEAIENYFSDAIEDA